MSLNGFLWVLVALVAAHLSVVGYLIRRGRSLEARALDGATSTGAAPSISARSARSDAGDEDDGGDAA
jgi:hypothetical protein